MDSSQTVVYVHAGKRVLFKNSLPNLESFFQCHIFISSIFDGLYNTSLLLIGPNLTQENGVSSNSCFDAVILNSGSNAVTGYRSFYKYVFWLTDHISMEFNGEVGCKIPPSTENTFFSGN